MGNEKKSIRRRQILAGACLGLVGLVKGVYFINKETEANIALMEFPSSISGAKEVRKYKIGGAEKCLVHILQAHYNREVNNLDGDYVTNVQRDIYDILSELINKRGIREVYAEGFVSEDISNFKTSLSGFFKDYNELISLESTYGAKLVSNNEFQAEINKARKVHSLILSEIEKKLGAVGRLVFEDKIIPKAGEILDTNEAAINDKIKGIISEKILDDREDILLDIISRTRDILSIAVYGGRHAFGGEKSCGKDYSLSNRFSFRDNVYEWNLKNPDRKFSLIEVVPKSYNFKVLFPQKQ